METGSPVLHGTKESRLPPDTPQIAKVQLSQEEIRVLRECNSESFYYRCLPFSAIGMGIAYLAVKNGYFRRHPKWGPAGKMTLAAFAGWIVGKVSYRTICEEKFLTLENSTIGNAIRKRRGLSTETFDNESQGHEDMTLKEQSYTSHDDYHSSLGSLNLDMDKNVPYSGLDDRERPTTDNLVLYSENLSSPRKTMTYEEMRKNNRESYEKQFSQPYSSKPEPSRNTELSSSWNPRDSNKNSPSNKYGDQWDK